MGLKDFGEIGLLPVKGLDIIYLPIDEAMLSCQHDRTAWSADGVGDSRSRKEDSLISDPVNVWGGIQTISIGTYCLIPVVIAHDKNNIRPVIIVLFFLVASGCQKEKQYNYIEVLHIKKS